MAALRSRRRMLAATAAAASVIVLVLTGCGPAAGTAPTDDYPGTPKGTTQRPSTELQNYAAWLENGSSIAIVLYGSSGCPPVGQSMVVRASNSLRVTTVPIPADKACTADYAPHTTVFRTPSEVTPTSDVSIEVPGSPSITLPALR